MHNESFNVGQTRENYRIREVAEMVKEVVPGSSVAFAADGGPDLRCYRVDCSKIQRVLGPFGFEPAWTVRQGIEDLHNAYRANGLTLDELQGARYLRIATIRKLLSSGSLDHSLRWRSPALV